MNVNKIQRLSEQWESLKRFYDSCCHKNMNLSVEGPAVPSVTLTQATTDLVMAELRKASLRELGKLEETIKEEAIK